MKHFLRLYRNRGSIGFVVLLGAGVLVGLLPHSAAAQGRRIAQIFVEPTPWLLHAGSQGYLGVDIADVDGEKAQALKLKEVRGAIITLIDHDAPAGQIGLKVNDVVLQLNGQTVESAEQLRRMLREIPAGRKVSLVISRDGNMQTLAVELADRRVMEHDVWNKIGTSSDLTTQASGMGILSSGGDGSIPSGFHMPIFGSSLNVGALVEPLTSQMAEYLGVPSGLMVKQVARKSAAAAAGLKAFDVILKVGSEAITTSSDWERSLHANQGKPVQIVILRDRKQQTVTLQVDSKRHQGKMKPEQTLPSDEEAQLVNLAQSASSIQGLLQTLPVDDLAKALQEQIQVPATPQSSALPLRNQLQSGSNALPVLQHKQMDEMQQHMDEMKRQMEALKPLGFDDQR